MIYIQTIIILIIIILFILLFLLIIYDKETFHNITETHEQTNNSIIISSNKNFEESKNKYVCFYAYYEKDEMYKENLVYFLNNGGILDNIDYYIIINGECTVNIPDLKNIIVIKKQNTGYDFGAWQHAIKKYMKLNYYDYYIFLNSSIRGPIIDDNKIWLDEFLELLMNSNESAKKNTLSN
jgi:hypothetical protein